MISSTSSCDSYPCSENQEIDFDELKSDMCPPYRFDGKEGIFVEGGGVARSAPAPPQLSLACRNLSNVIEERG